jgi:hypothetical protein
LVHRDSEMTAAATAAYICGRMARMRSTVSVMLAPDRRKMDHYGKRAGGGGGLRGAENAGGEVESAGFAGAVCGVGAGVPSGRK